MFESQCSKGCKVLMKIGYKEQILQGSQRGRIEMLQARHLSSDPCSQAFLKNVVSKQGWIG